MDSNIYGRLYKKIDKICNPICDMVGMVFNIDLVAQQVEHYTYEFSIISKNRLTCVVQLIECAGLEINQHGSQV